MANDILYVISAGPLAEIIISDLYKNNPNNCYIDFGSSIDQFIHNKKTRAYMDETTFYAKRNCAMYNPKTIKCDISVILTAYKKPQSLRKQLESIKTQTVQPKEILLFQDGIDEDYKIVFDDELLSEFSNVKICDTNYGVWERFKYANATANSTYVCIFDDDAIPGQKWLENCLAEMHKKEGLYGTIGVVFDKPENYPYRDWFRVGWDGNLEYTARVDIVGHSWFLKKDWLKYLFEDTEKYQKYKIVGEDITLSYKLQQHGIKTYVPPHPKNNQEYWGSLKESAMKFGTDSCAISANSHNIAKMQLFIQDILKDKYVILKKEDPKYYYKLRKELLPKYYKLHEFIKIIERKTKNRIKKTFGLK